MAQGVDRGRVLWQLALDVLDQVHRVAPRSHLGSLLALAVVLGSSAAAGCRALGRSWVSAALGALAGSALAVAIGLTLFRGGFGRGHLARLGHCAVTSPVLLSGDGAANLLLFAPAAFLAVLAVGRPLVVAAGVSVVSLVVEGLQAVQWRGVCDTSDLLLNSLGGLAAALAAAALRAAVPGSVACPRSC